MKYFSLFRLYQHVKEHRQTPFPFVDDAKLGTIPEQAMAFRVACSNMF